MRSTSRQQVDALERGDLPPLDRVRDDVWALAQPMPGGHLAYSFTYLLRDADGGVHVIDPGWDSDSNWDRLTAALAEIAPGAVGAGAVTGITGTHLHPDHVGMAARLRGASGAPLAMHAVERRALERHRVRQFDVDEALGRLADWGVPAGRRRELAQDVDRSPEELVLVVDRELDDGDLLAVAGFRVSVMSTPGHTAGHLCLRDDDRDILYTGDHVLPTVFPGLGLGGATPSNPLADYLASVERILPYGGYEAAPGHGYLFAGLGERAAACADHQLERAREVASVLAGSGGGPSGPTVWEIASRLTWTAGWDGLHGFQLLSALSQTRMHQDFVSTHGLP
ncbi:MBL fold metallo-hydrolase [Arthrobacter sp. B0490]|uniref:MBL fold metallo-hydrolase n=1 Tax=Arthrobacter sp. B0490 TaxID=2058891 RepID=UPI000CE45188|nr:MBL fold metallo-hydrolase [Arthrobacter sp. B0490]